MEWIYPILGKQKCLPFYLSGVGIAEPEYHVIREEGLVSHQLHYTQSGRGNLVVGGATYPLEPGSMFYMAPGIHMSIIRLLRMSGRPVGWCFVGNICWN